MDLSSPLTLYIYILTSIIHERYLLKQQIEAQRCQSDGWGVPMSVLLSFCNTITVYQIPSSGQIEHFKRLKTTVRKQGARAYYLLPAASPKKSIKISICTRKNCHHRRSRLRCLFQIDQKTPPFRYEWSPTALVPERHGLPP